MQKEGSKCDYTLLDSAEPPDIDRYERCAKVGIASAEALSAASENADYIAESDDTVTMSLAKHNTVAAKCDVAGCENDAERSFNIKQVSKSQLILKSDDLRQVHLCKEHYKEYKKQTKTEREIGSIYD